MDLGSGLGLNCLDPDPTHVTWIKTCLRPIRSHLIRPNPLISIRSNISRSSLGPIAVPMAMRLSPLYHRNRLTHPLNYCRMRQWFPGTILQIFKHKIKMLIKETLW